MVVRHLTFATSEYRRSARALALSARSYGITVEIFSPASPEIRSLRASAAGIMEQRRGYGYWLWKPYLLRAALSAAHDGDLILYTDAAVTFVADPQPLLSLAERQDVVLFHEAMWTLGEWTKRDVFLALDADSDLFWRAPSLTAGFQLYRASAASRAFISDLLNACLSPGLLTDTPSFAQNLPQFREHRHDQAILGVLAAKRGVKTYPDPTQYGAMEGGLAVFDHHRRRDSPLLGGLRSRLQLRTRLKRLFGHR